MPKIPTGAEYHALAAQDHEQAAEHHRQASAHYMKKEYAFAAHQAVIAYGHMRHAVHHASEAGKFHAERDGKESLE
jgi:hypothetical protein